MIVAVLSMVLLIPGSRSLKEKRAVLKRVKDTMARELRVSVAEVGDHKDSWDAAELAVAVVSDDGGVASSLMEKVLDFTRRQKGLEIAHYDTRFVG